MRSGTFTYPHVVGASGQPLDVVAIEGLTADSVIGLYPSERSREQQIEIDVALHLDLRGVTSDKHIDMTVDYARLAGELRFIAEHGELELLETAAHAMAAYVLAPPTQDARRAAVNEVTLRLSKPTALSGKAMPSIIVHRGAHDYVYKHESRPWGAADVIYQTPSCGIYRLRIRAGGQIPAHVHRTTRESELVLGSGLFLQGKPVRRGTAHTWPHGHAHRYDNPSPIEQTILCINRPPFVPSDEILAESMSAMSPVPSRTYYPDEDPG